MITECTKKNIPNILYVINDASLKYKGIIPNDCWHEPYMTKQKLISEFANDVRIFGYNKNLELEYSGRIKELKDLKPVRKGDSDLKLAMKLVAETGTGPKNQIPSMGCNIKWIK